MRIVDALTAGIDLGALRLAGRLHRGRFPEEVNVDVSICDRRGCRPLFYVKAFRGRPPFYRPWIEVHGVSSVEYALVEDIVLPLAAASLGTGARLFHEYAWDPVTTRELELGVPAPATRLGFKLLALGFTWFKDWYYPEGFMEGAQRLQAEKPVSERHASETLAQLASELEEFLDRSTAPVEALVRARAALRIVEAYTRALDSDRG